MYKFDPDDLKAKQGNTSFNFNDYIPNSIKAQSHFDSEKDVFNYSDWNMGEMTAASRQMSQIGIDQYSRPQLNSSYPIKGSQVILSDISKINLISTGDRTLNYNQS